MITNPKKEFSFEDLQKMDLSCNQAFLLRLEDDEIIECEKILRLLPQKRLVVTGTWQDREIVAKLFFDSRHAPYHIEREMAGIQSLQQNKVPTPDILHKTATMDKRVQVLLLDHILESRNLHDVWVAKEDEELYLPLLKAVVIEIATQHVLGLVQQDLHFKNFLLTDKTIYTLDGAQFQRFPFLLPRKPSMKNLALFLSQFGAGAETLQEILFRHYAKARGWTIKEEDRLEMFFLIKQWNQLRWEKCEKKIWRDSTQFSQMKRWNAFGMLDRHYVGPELLHFLENPEEVFNQAQGTSLKKGDSTTVKKIKLDNHYYVIKRYNLKSFFHALRRCLRPTRAALSWRIAHKMQLFYVSTAKPVAFVEKRILGLRGKSYWITEYVSTENAGDYLAMQSPYPEKISAMITRITHLIKSLLSIEVSHGDLKITNILIDKQELPTFIDLDGAAEHTSWSGLWKGFKKDRRRFLRNFDSNPTLREKFEEEFNK